jgi:predicted MFS family arabinose efflux permease
MLFNPSIASIGHWFSERRALATGLACTAGGAGGVFFPLMILYLSPRIGFAWAIRAVALVCLVMGLCACILLQKRLPHNKKAGGAVDLKALREPKFAVTTLAVFLIEFAVFIPYTYICSYGIYVGMDRQNAYLLNALVNAGAIPGRAIPGYLADRFGHFNVMCITALTCAVFILSLWFPSSNNNSMVVGFAVLFGFWSGAAISLTPVCIGQVCKTEDYGKRSGTSFFVSSFGCLIGMPIAGVILEARGGDYHGLILFAGAFYLAACGAFYLARGSTGAWSLRAKA